MDLQMPEMDGFEATAQHPRARARQRRAPADHRADRERDGRRPRALPRRPGWTATCRSRSTSACLLAEIQRVRIALPRPLGTRAPASRTRRNRRDRRARKDPAQILFCGLCVLRGFFWTCIPRLLLIATPDRSRCAGSCPRREADGEQREHLEQRDEGVDRVAREGAGRREAVITGVEAARGRCRSSSADSRRISASAEPKITTVPAMLPRIGWRLDPARIREQHADERRRRRHHRDPVPAQVIHARTDIPAGLLACTTSCPADPVSPSAAASGVLPLTVSFTEKAPASTGGRPPRPPPPPPPPPRPPRPRPPPAAPAADPTRNDACPAAADGGSCDALPDRVHRQRVRIAAAAPDRRSRNAGSSRRRRSGSPA